jgi:hypothetical protein
MEAIVNNRKQSIDSVAPFVPVHHDSVSDPQFRRRRRC